jgi:hypothetical protein
MHGLCVTCDCLTHSHPTSRSVRPCVDVECDAWVWMRHMRLPDSFSSNLKVSEAACVWMRECVDAWVWMQPETA